MQSDISPSDTPRSPASPADTGPSLTPTGRVILGMIALGQRTGYDIKQLVDKSTNNFWAASYGQIYPELKRLEEQGLVTGRAEPTGSRPRMVYDLTDAGRKALSDWLESATAKMFEVRDEGMLRLFFSDFVSPERRLEIVREMRAWHEGTLARLESLEVHGGPRKEGPRLTLSLGIGLHRWIVEWCEATERALAQEQRQEDKE
jgi:PadR family transcriptional regulator, regulatory protein AphA